MNSLSSLIIKRRNHNNRAALAMPAQSYSAIKSSSIVNDYFVKLYASTHCSLRDEQINCINQRKDDHHSYRRSVVITNTSSNFRSTAIRNNHPYQMKRYQHRGFFSSKQRTMIDVDQVHSHGLMQSFEQTSLSSSPVNQLQKTLPTIDSNSSQKKIPPLPSRIRLALRSACPLDEKQQQLFDQIFSNHEQTANISEGILDRCLARVAKNSSDTLLIITGNYREVHPIQTAILTSTVRRLWDFTQENSEKDYILRINVEEYSNNQTSNCILSASDYTVSSSQETSHYLTNLCFNHRFHSLLLTFTLESRSLNTTYAFLNILLTNDTDNESTKEQFSNLLMSLALSYSSNRQKQNLYRKRSTPSTPQSLASLLTDYLARHLVYLFGNVKSEKQLKYWLKIQRLLRMKKTSMKMTRDRFDSSPMNRTQEEIWIDGPLSSPTSKKKEIWIDGPEQIRSYSPKKSPSKHRSTSHKSKAAILSPAHPLLSSTSAHQDSPSSNFDTESIISSHCHVPSLPVFKDHSLLPFRSTQTLPRNKSSTKLDLRLSTNKLNDDMELLEKTLETLLVPSTNGQQEDLSLSRSWHRIDRLSSLMSNDEKSKRLSRIVSPTRFDKHSHSSTDFHSPSAGSSVPNSPLIQSKTHHLRTPAPTLSREPSQHLLLPTKRTKPSTNTPTSSTRPSLFQRLFGLRSSTACSSPAMPIPIVIHTPPSSPLISPLTVTLDSHDDLMPLTTSSTTSSASGRASSSGYESMSNTVLEEMIAAVNHEASPVKLRSRSVRKETNTSWNSPNLHDKSHRQQRLAQLKHRQNELKLELAMTKTFLLMDKTKTSEQNDSATSTINNNTPMHCLLSNANEEDELEKEIDHLERRLALAKSQLIYVTYQKNKQGKS